MGPPVYPYAGLLKDMRRIRPQADPREGGETDILLPGVREREAGMTLPDEQMRALVLAERLLASLLHPQYAYHGQKWPRIPKILRKAARNVLRHYPTESEVNRCWKP